MSEPDGFQCSLPMLSTILADKDRADAVLPLAPQRNGNAAVRCPSSAYVSLADSTVMADGHLLEPQAWHHSMLHGKASAFCIP